ncbi:cation:proton antiporter [Actinomadura chokoriensis]|uniref:Cation:proton antiporter n=1 Tax=Actinomadura chokoriensis TaxID=454156 RepID=A0ABV4R5B3_9ACTN
MVDQKARAKAGAGDASGSGGGGGGRTRRLASFLSVYVLLVLVPAAVIVVLLAGGGLGGEAAHSSVRPTPGGTGHSVSRFLLAVAAVLVAGWVMGALFERMRQPRVVGEICAGILLGPSFLGAAWPGAANLLFPAAVLSHVAVLSQLGLVLFMFVAGAELRPALLRGQVRVVFMVSHAGIAVPFALGVALSPSLYSEFAGTEASPTTFALFLGLALSITALPVLARILVDREMQDVRLGALSLGSAAVGDVTAWCLLAGAVAMAGNASPVEALRVLAWTLLFVLVLVGVVRPMLGRLVSAGAVTGPSDEALFALLVGGALLAATATEYIGLHAVFGAFAFGTAVPRGSEQLARVLGRLETLTLFLLPLFFVQVGLRTDLGAGGWRPATLLATLLVCAVAIAGKLASTGAAARAAGLPWRDAAAVGVLMNCRGVTELVILDICLELRVIGSSLYSGLVVMALATTAMTSPILDLLERSRPDGGASRHKDGADVRPL